MALNLFKRVDSVKGLFAVESISLIYNALTTIMVLILFPRMDHPVIMLSERAGIVAITFALIYLYRKYPCKLTAFIRMAVQMAFLAYWYPDTFEFNRLFPNLDKALYLDADLVINGSIEPLWELDLEGYYCAGVDDIFIRRINYRKILELAEKDVYINAGVLLLNLKDLRKDKIQEKLLQHTSIYINRDRYQDQDAINCICKGKIKLIPNIYNFTTSETLHTPEMLSDIIIIHYTGSIKPWHQEYTWQVLKELYCKYNSSMNKIKNRLLSRWMERTIEFFQLSQKTNDTELEEEADKLLNKIIDHCSLAVPITYENGLCGIGTGIEYLLQKKLVEGNSDEILHQIDSAVYSVIEQKSLTDLGLGKGVSGLAYYFYSRLCTRENFNTPTALKIKEYLFHLINWIAELLPDTNNRPVLCEVYLVLSLLHELNIPQAPIETLMRNSLSQITGY